MLGTGVEFVRVTTPKLSSIKAVLPVASTVKATGLDFNRFGWMVVHLRLFSLTGPGSSFLCFPVSAGLYPQWVREDSHLCSLSLAGPAFLCLRPGSRISSFSLVALPSPFCQSLTCWHIPLFSVPVIPHLLQTLFFPTIEGGCIYVIVLM